MQRREFITLLGGARDRCAARRARAAGRARAAHRRAHGRGRGRSGSASSHRGVPARAAAIGLERRPQRAHRIPLEPRAMRTRMRKNAAELVALAPDVILADGSVRHATAAAGDPHRADRVRAASPIRSAPAASRAWRGPAATPPDLSIYEYGLSGKWLELLKQLAPGVTRVAVIRDAAVSAGIGQFARHPVRGTVVRGGVDAGRCAATRPRSSARSLTSRASAEWRSDRDRRARWC